MKKILIAAAAAALIASPAFAGDHGHKKDSGHGQDAHASHGPVADKVIADQRKALAKNTKDKGFGP